MSPNCLHTSDDKAAIIYQRVKPALLAHCKEQALDQKIIDRLQSIYVPLALWINQQHEQHDNKVIVIGINGALGAGKSTLTRLLKVILEQGFDKRSFHLSLDDLYFSKQKRQILADEIHPLLMTRGVPGTHDVAAGINILEQCRAGTSGEIQVPAFDKSIDDLKPDATWTTIQLPVDIVLFEGWCIGARPQQDEDLQKPVNRLEADEDPDGIWRKYVNQQLAGDYQQLFGMIDKLIMMKVPSMQQVLRWRSDQEDKLSAFRENSGAGMSREQIARFILHDERLILHQLDDIPKHADIVLVIGKDQQLSVI